MLLQLLLVLLARLFDNTVPSLFLSLSPRRDEFASLSLSASFFSFQKIKEKVHDASFEEPLSVSVSVSDRFSTRRPRHPRSVHVTWQTDITETAISIVTVPRFKYFNSEIREHKQTPLVYSNFFLWPVYVSDRQMIHSRCRLCPYSMSRLVDLYINVEETCILHCYCCWTFAW